ncbi:hypothetical protein AB0I55_20280 [Actinocatenispora sera]|uniref:hypothetical protein n=1 Tax=Actinocatenispora sera TaxID=390989 RepID=UPI0034056C1A
MDDDPAAGGNVHATMRVALWFVTAVLLVGLSLRPVLEQRYRYHWLAVAAFVALAGITAAGGGWVLRRRPLPGAVTAAGTAVTLAAGYCATSALTAGEHFGAADWSFGLVEWYLLLLLLDRVPLLLAALGTHLALSVGLFLAAGQPDRVEIGAVGIVVLGSATVQLSVVVIARALARSTRRTSAAIADRDRMQTQLLLAEQWERGQRNDFAGQLGLTLPLLAELADGLADPRESETRRRCALAATQLRRLFAENDESPDPLVHEITACIDIAERRGVVVSLAVSGTAVAVPTAVRHELTGPVVAALSVARNRARVSVLRTTEEVRVAVVTDAGAAGTAPPGSMHVEVECGSYGQDGRMEARWRRASS